MRNGVFGWSLPPGCTHAMIEAQCEEGPCAVCCLEVGSCVCPECRVCHEAGNPMCYRGPHGLKLNKEQVIHRQEARIYVAELRVGEEKMVLDMYRDSEQKEWDIDDVADPWG